MMLIGRENICIMQFFLLLCFGVCSCTNNSESNNSETEKTVKQQNNSNLKFDFIGFKKGEGSGPHGDTPVLYLFKIENLTDSSKTFMAINKSFCYDSFEYIHSNKDSAFTGIAECGARDYNEDHFTIKPHSIDTIYFALEKAYRPGIFHFADTLGVRYEIKY